MDQEKIKKFLEYVEKLRDGEHDPLIESIVEGFSSLYEYRIDTKQPSDDLMEMGPIATAVAGGVVSALASKATEELLEDEEEVKDEEGEYIRKQLSEISEYSEKLKNLIKEDDEEFMSWFQDKISTARDLIDSCFHYYDNEKKDDIESEEEENPIMEETAVKSPMEVRQAEDEIMKKLSEVRDAVDKLLASKVISVDEKIAYLKQMKERFEEDFGISLADRAKMSGYMEESEGDMQGIMVKQRYDVINNLLNLYKSNLKK